jgi:hypothetical protein
VNGAESHETKGTVLEAGREGQQVVLHTWQRSPSLEKASSLQGDPPCCLLPAGAMDSSQLWGEECVTPSQPAGWWKGGSAPPPTKLWTKTKAQGKEIPHGTGTRF